MPILNQNTIDLLQGIFVVITDILTEVIESGKKEFVFIKMIFNDNYNNIILKKRIIIINYIYSSFYNNN